MPYTVVVESCIDGEFDGWDGDSVWELCNGQLWMQVGYSYRYHYAYRPDVTIVLYEGFYFMAVEGVDDLVAVQQITDFTKTCIDGTFEGWSGDTIFELCNGQVWQQAEYDYMYDYAYRPDVLIYATGFGYQMKVEGVSDSISVKQLTNVIKTCISGTFEGWSGDTIFELCNGQTWQQTSYSYLYHYAYRPDVLIYYSGFGYQMKVDGVSDSVGVSQIY